MTLLHLNDGEMITLWLLMGILFLSVIGVGIGFSFFHNERWTPLCVGAAIFLFGLGTLGMRSADRINNANESLWAQQQFDRLSQNYKLKDVSWQTDEKHQGQINHIFFTDPEGNLCEGAVDDAVIYDVSCKKVYHQEAG